MPPEETKKALIVVRTYPTPASKGAEVSCMAAITDKGEWLRLFPVPWRYLRDEQKFRRYQWVEVNVTKASDPRPESYKLKQDGIKIVTEPLSTDHNWRLRRDIIDPLRSHCMCCLRKQLEDKGHPTLGLFKPKKIEKLMIEQDSPSWTQAQLDILNQGHLFAEKPKKQLEKVPYKFSYRFRCDHSECNGHTMICTDWEIAEAYRKWKQDYGDKWEDAFRNRFEKEMIEKFDTHFYVGTVHQHPKSWIIVGLFYPPQDIQQGLFASSPSVV